MIANQPTDVEPSPKTVDRADRFSKRNLTFKEK